MTGAIETCELAPTSLMCATCVRPLAGCWCTIESLAAACLPDVRGTLIDGKPAAELVVASGLRRRVRR